MLVATMAVGVAALLSRLGPALLVSSIAATTRAGESVRPASSNTRLTAPLPPAASPAARLQPIAARTPGASLMAPCLPG